jgi:hypothetical protein
MKIKLSHWRRLGLEWLVKNVLRPKIRIVRVAKKVDEIVLTIWGVVIVHLEKMDENYWWGSILSQDARNSLGFYSSKNIQLNMDEY